MGLAIDSKNELGTGFSPFDIYFRYIDDGVTVEGFEPLDPGAVACYEAYSVGKWFLFLFEMILINCYSLF